MALTFGFFSFYQTACAELINCIYKVATSKSFNQPTETPSLFALKKKKRLHHVVLVVNIILSTVMSKCISLHLCTQVLHSPSPPPLSGPTKHWVPFNLAFIHPIITESVIIMGQALCFPLKAVELQLKRVGLSV